MLAAVSSSAIAAARPGPRQRPHRQHAAPATGKYATAVSVLPFNGGGKTAPAQHCGQVIVTFIRLECGNTDNRRRRGDIRLADDAGENPGARAGDRELLDVRAVGRTQRRASRGQRRGGLQRALRPQQQPRIENGKAERQKNAADQGGIPVWSLRSAGT